MAVAPHGRIDVVFNDTRNTGLERYSELYYTYSYDAGRTWSRNEPVSRLFDSWVGWPNQNKLGDYYDMISDDAGVNIAYAATFNGEQDVYFLRIDLDCNDNGITDTEEVTAGSSPDCDNNYRPDECDPDIDGDGFIDGCDDDMDGDGVLNDADVCAYTPVDAPAHDNGRPLSDTNGDCRVGLIDYARLRRCLADSGPDLASPPATCQTPFDYDGDEDVDLFDFSGFMAASNGGY
jgi:hypothetical protein